MTQSGQSRLDRIENILLSTATRLDQVSQQQQVNADAISELRSSQQANAEAISELRSSQQANAEAITQLSTQMEQGFAESSQQLQESASYLVGIIGDFVEELQQDRAIIREMQAEVRGLQTENQRILQYLFGQQQGGGGALS
jgi:hypothetical protein